MNRADTAPLHPRSRVVARAALIAYAIILAMIALWPVPVDSGAGDFLRAVHQVFPALTYERIEFSANILLFVPLGVLLMLILRRRYLILPIALVVTAGIESAQALLLDRRTPSMTDIIANTTGACIGMLIIAVVETVRARSVPAVAATPRARVQKEADAWTELGLAPPVRRGRRCSQSGRPRSRRSRCRMGFPRCLQCPVRSRARSAPLGARSGPK